MNNTINPRVYVASLTDYSSGILHGVWVDFTESAGRTEDAHQQIEDMLKASPSAKREGAIAEEWAIHDHEGFPTGLVQEHSDIDELADWAEFIEKVDNEDLVQAAIECTNLLDLSDIEELIENNYVGSFDAGGLANWAQEQCEDCDDGSLKNLPQFIACHIDWEGVGRDMLHDYNYSEVKGTTYLFSN